MSGNATEKPQRRRRRVEEEAHENDERWLLTYSDMITLLMALFIVMWSISSVNVSKFQQLKVSLSSAFSGKVLPSQTSILNGGSAPFEQSTAPVTASSATQPAFKMNSIKAQLQQQAKSQDMQSLKRIQQAVEAFARAHGLSGTLRTSIDERGLVVQLLTDKVLFDPGAAVLQPLGMPLLAKIATLLDNGQIPNQIRVEGNTDSTPIHTGQFRSNWELSTARADAVLQFMLTHGVGANRLSVAGYADQRPIASNATAEGRALNRRVNLVVLRRTFSKNP